MRLSLVSLSHHQLNSFAISEKLFSKNNDDLDYSTSTVEHIKLKDFLLMDEV